MPSIPRAYLAHIAGMILAGILWMTSLYQLEVIYIWLAEGRTIFEFPFYIWTCGLPMARDIWYGVNALAFTIAVAISTHTRFEKREEEAQCELDPHSISRPVEEDTGMRRSKEEMIMDHPKGRPRPDETNQPHV